MASSLTIKAREELQRAVPPTCFRDCDDTAANVFLRQECEKRVIEEFMARSNV